MLKVIKGRWQLRGWKFSPLERLDGQNEMIESLDALRDSPVSWSSISPEIEGRSVEHLIEDLDDLYRDALETWVEFKTVFECKRTQREFLKWPDGTYPATIRKEAFLRFWELVTTTRFSVNADPSVFNLQRVNFLHSKVTIRHAVSLAAMVCIKDAIDALEWVEYWWIDESQIYRRGKSYQWLTQHAPSKLELILATVYETADERGRHIEKVKDAWAARDQAERWLTHLETLNFAKVEFDQTKKVAKLEKSRQARTAAQKPRKAANLTPEIAASYFNRRANEKWESVCVDLAVEYEVSERTVARRYASAQKLNLVT